MTYTSPFQWKEKIVGLVDTLCSTVLKDSTTHDDLGGITNESLMQQWKEEFLTALEPERDPWVNYSRPLSVSAIENELEMITIYDSKHFFQCRFKEGAAGGCVYSFSRLLHPSEIIAKLANAGWIEIMFNKDQPRFSYLGVR